MLITAACFFRVGMMALPLETSAYNLTLDPENYPRWSVVWWANTGRYLLYVAGTAGNQVQHLYLLRIVDVAMRVLEPNRQGFFDRNLGKALNVGFAVCMVWVTILLLSQFVRIDYNTALNMSSFSYLLVSTIMVCLFPIVWTRLFDALAIVTRHRSKAEALREALFPWCTRKGCCGFAPCCRARSDGSGLSIALNDTAQLQNIVSARQKLTVFTQLAAVATAAVFSKCMVLGYMTIGIIAGDFEHPSVVGDTFWIVVIIDYFVTEVFPFAATIYILWKPLRQGRRRTTATVPAPRSGGSSGTSSQPSSWPSSWHAAPTRNTETESLASDSLSLAAEDVEADHGGGL